MLVVLRALGLGDLLTAVPALRALAAAFPGDRKVLAAPGALGPLALLSGAVDEVVAVDALAPLPSPLHHADVAVNLHGRGPHSHRVLLGGRPRRLIAFASDEVPETAGFPRWRADEHEVTRWCRLLAECGIPADPRDLDLSEPRPATPLAVPGATVVHPGAAFPSRRWPRQRWTVVAEHEGRAGRPVLITGSPDERPLALGVARGAGLPDSAVLAGTTDLIELAGVVAAAGRVVCGDTGVAHLATALRTPSVVLFGPVPPCLWGPPSDRPWHRALWAGRAGDPHGDRPDPGLLDLTVDDVLATLDELPTAPQPRVTTVSPCPAS